ncbi:MAG: ABC transporter permease [Acholeplasmataceae bacterium]|nr:ABC transporter permease [Acholeplasmataceae bacterium]
MKLLSTYLKEIKIASRGFYFYIEIFIAILLLVVVLVAIDDYPDSKAEEYVYYDMSDVQFDSMLAMQLASDSIIQIEDSQFDLKAVSFDVLNIDSEQVTSYVFESSKTISVPTLQMINVETNQIIKTIYIVDSLDDLLRLSLSSGNAGSKITTNELDEVIYTYIIQGYETERYVDFLYLTHSIDESSIAGELASQDVVEIGSSNRLTNKEAIVPVFVVFAGSLMGLFIVIAYLFLDKGQGVIKALAVTPSTIGSYLLSKNFVIMTTVVISSSIVAIPIMGLKPNYFLFYVFLLITTFAFSSIGLFVSSFFDSIGKSFGVVYILMIVLMIPVISYYNSSFDPLWIKFFPTYPVLQGFKGILMGQPDWAYVSIYAGVFLLAGIGILGLANIRFKKSLTI